MRWGSSCPTRGAGGPAAPTAGAATRAPLHSGGTGPATWPHRSPRWAGSAPSLHGRRSGAHLAPPGRHRPRLRSGGCGQDGMVRSPSRVPQPATTAATRGPTTEPRNPTPPDDPARPRFEPALPARRRPAPARKAPLPGDATGASAPTEPARRPPPAATTHGTPRSTPLSAMGTVSTPAGTAALLCMSRHRGIISATSVRNVPNRRRSGKKRAGPGENRLGFLIRSGGARWVDLRFATCPGCNVG